MKAKIEKKATKLMKKTIKEESEKHTFFGYHQVPPNYPPPSSQYPSSQFQSVHLGKLPYFDEMDYPMSAYDMKMHLYELHPCIWEVVVVDVTPPKNGIPTAEQAHDYFCNAQVVRVIIGSLCAQEFNKIRSVEIAKVIWDTLKEAHEGTNQLEHFIMLEEETVTQMFDRLMLLVSDIRTLGSTDWDDHKVTKKMLRAFTPRNPTLATMIRRDPSFETKTPNQLLGEILPQELVDRDVEKSLSMRMNKSLALNASSSTMIESSLKALKSKKEDSSEEGSTDEETAFAIRNYKKFLKKTFKKNGDDRKKMSQRRCYECKEVGHFIDDCPHKKKKEMEEKRFNDEESNKECMTTLTILKPTAPTKLFNNTSNNEDDTPFCLMAKGSKVLLNTTSSSSISSSISMLFGRAPKPIPRQILTPMPPLVKVAQDATKLM
uniref:CCHC-type domain-containing protein n=1 Tax=Setaria italica TaxID=4555 RepID=K4A379_SETIT